MVLTSTSRFFKDKKINEAHRMSAIWSPWKKNKKLIYTKLHLKSCYYLLIVYMKKSISESRETKFWQRARYLQFAPVLQIDTRVTWKMHLFKPIPARNFFPAYYYNAYQILIWIDERHWFVNQVSGLLILTKRNQVKRSVRNKEYEHWKE